LISANAAAIAATTARTGFTTAAAGRREPPGSLASKGRQLPSAPGDERSSRREFHEALLEAGSFDDLSGKWQAAILQAEQNRPQLRVSSD